MKTDHYIKIEIKGVPADLFIPVDLANKEGVARMVHFFNEFGDDKGFQNESIKIGYVQSMLVGIIDSFTMKT